VAAAVVAGTAYLVLSITVAIGIAAAVLFLEAVGVAVGNVTTLSLRQRVIPSELLGRVGAAFRLLLFGLAPIGALAGGVVTAAFGVRHAFFVAGAVQLVSFAVAAPFLLRRIHQAERSWSAPAR
jgi:hypothetical protein